MRFKIGSQVYDAEAIDQLSLRDILQLETETTNMGHPLRWSDVQQISRELADLPTDDERSQHPSAIWLLAITIWASRRRFGEDLTFAQAIDFPLVDLDYLPEPEDHQKPAHPTKARAGSARAAKPRAVAATTSPPTLRAASTGD